MFARTGRPSLLLTFTSNPAWPDILDNLYEGQRTSDRPDIATRVFFLKFKELLNIVIDQELFGAIRAWTYCVEFQKRGLPHSHLVASLEDPKILEDIDKLDQMFSAEIPDKEKSPRLYGIVTKMMTHKCNARCTKDGKVSCTYGYPKTLRDTTFVEENGTVHLRRRPRPDAKDGLSNANIVSYCPILSLYFNCHVNVEVCNTMMDAKYVTKYTFKGPDLAEYRVMNDRDEIMDYLLGRYISMYEAVYRLLKYPLSQKSHVIVRLPVHLEGEQTIVFQESLLNANAQEAMEKQNQLLGFFELNKRLKEEQKADPTKQVVFHTYPEVPEHYRWVDNKWQPRIRSADKVLGRMEIFGFNDENTTALRTLLLHCTGVTSYEDLRTVAGVVHDTFLQAARALNYIEKEDIWHAVLESNFKGSGYSGRAKRRLFAMLLEYFSDPLATWNKFKDLICKDVENRNRAWNRQMIEGYAMVEITKFAKNPALLAGFPDPNARLYSSASQPTAVPKPKVISKT